jgi:hypothetical protein
MLSMIVCIYMYLELRRLQFHHCPVSYVKVVAEVIGVCSYHPKIS